MSVSGSRGPAGMPRWSIPVAAAAVIVTVVFGIGGYEVAAHFNARPTPTPRPTATAQPTPTFPPTPTSTSPIFQTSTATLTPSPTPTSSQPLTADPPVIRAHGYTPGPATQVSDGQGGALYAWIGTCSNSGDGYCQKVFFFDNTNLLGTDTSKPSTQIIKLGPAGTGQVWVQYANYAPSDPLCCPSRKPVTITYTWDGSRLTANGTPPGH